MSFSINPASRSVTPLHVAVRPNASATALSLGANPPTAGHGVTNLGKTPALTSTRPKPFDPRQIFPAIKQAWAASTNDTISHHLALNQSLIGGTRVRIAGLGAALLSRFKSTTDNYHQAVTDYFPRNSLGEVSSVQALNNLASRAPHKFNLSIHTASGAQVNVVIQNLGDGRAGQEFGLSVDIHTEGTLRAAEQKAISELAQAYETTLAAMTEIPPRVNVSRLTRYDSTNLTGVDFSYTDSTPGSMLKSFKFQANANQRSLHVNSTMGDIAVDVHMDQPQLWGTPAQQQKAVGRFLTQFDTAGRRSHANIQLLTLFKNSFEQLNSNYPSLKDIPEAPQSNDAIDDVGHALLTGLGDFSASVSGMVGQQNGYESGQFNYAVQQNTVIKNSEDGVRRNVTQAQNAKLDAHWLAAAKPGKLLDVKSGDYNTYLVSDNASSSVSMDYDKGIMTQAVLTKGVKEFMRFQKVREFKVVEQTDTPFEDAVTQNLMASVKEIQTKNKRDLLSAQERDTLLGKLNDRIFMQTGALPH